LSKQIGILNTGLETGYTSKYKCGHLVDLDENGEYPYECKKPLTLEERIVTGVLDLVSDYKARGIAREDAYEQYLIDLDWRETEADEQAILDIYDMIEKPELLVCGGEKIKSLLDYREEQNEKKQYVSQRGAYSVYTLNNKKNKRKSGIDPLGSMLLAEYKQWIKSLLEGNVVETVLSLGYWFQDCACKQNHCRYLITCALRESIGTNVIAGEEYIKDLAYYVKHLRDIDIDDYYCNVCARITIALSKIFREEFEKIKNGRVLDDQKPRLTPDEIETLNQAAKIAKRIRGNVSREGYKNIWNRAAINIEYGIENLLLGDQNEQM
jgi:hypothetical protein